MCIRSQRGTDLLLTSCQGQLVISLPSWEGYPATHGNVNLRKIAIKLDLLQMSWGCEFAMDVQEIIET